MQIYLYISHNNKWSLEVIRATVNLSARVAKSFNYYCEYIL